MKRKIKRFLTSFLPISKERTGNCNGCGDCCKLPNVCPFLKTNEVGNYRCSIYLFRPPSCRKYPRTAKEFITPEKCGYRFPKQKEIEPSSIIFKSVP